MPINDRHVPITVHGVPIVDYGLPHVEFSLPINVRQPPIKVRSVPIVDYGVSAGHTTSALPDLALPSEVNPERSKVHWNQEVTQST